MTGVEHSPHGASPSRQLFAMACPQAGRGARARLVAARMQPAINAWSCVAILWLSLLSMSSAFAQTATVPALIDQFCAGDRGGSSLGCTANDFTASVDFTQGSATAVATCFVGDPVIVDVIATLTSSSPVRYDVGLFVGQNGQDPGTNFTTGSNNDSQKCSLGVFPTTPSPFFSADTDVCGDFTNNSSATLQVTGVKVICQAVSPTDNRLNLPFLVAFDNQVSGNTCSASNLTAGTSSKCTKSSAGGLTGVAVQGWIDLTKQTEPDGDTSTFNFTTTTQIGSVLWTQGGVSTTPTLTDGQTKRVSAPITGPPPPAAPVSSNTLTITETLQSLWDSGADITCAALPGSGNPVTVDKQARKITALLTTTNYAAACTITNSKRSKITLAKSVGGRVASTDQFTVSATTTGDFQDLTNGALTSPRSVTTSGVQTSVNTVFTTRQRVSSSASTSALTPASVTITDAAAGTTNLADYDTRLTCTNAFTGTGATPNASLPSNQSLTTYTFTPAPADDITCTFTNTPKPRITLQKAIAAAGGRLANTDQFALTDGTSTGTTTGTGSSVTSAPLLFVGTAGSAVTLSEAAAGTTSLANYATAISCTNGNGSSSTTLPSGSGTSFTVTPANNDVIACTLTNTRKSATLTLRKSWVNAVLNNAVNVSATGIQNRTFGSVANTATEIDTDATTINVFAGETVALAEAFTTGTATNYTAGLTCTGNNGTLTYTAGNLTGSLAIANNDTAITCTFANTRKSATLTLQKTWVNGASGDAVSVTTTGAVNNATLASTSTGNNTTVGTAATVFAGESIVLPAESFTTGSAANYVKTLACTGNANALAGSTAPQTLSIASGDSAITCTYTNTRTSLTLVKTVTNDNGGTQAASAWTLTGTGPVTISGASGSANVTNAAVTAGTYALTESGPAGYTAGSWSCAGGSQSGSNITLTSGQAATCTINNNDQAATLTLVKTVTNNNGGTAAATAWTLTATGPTSISGATGAAAVTSAAVNAGTYTLGESGPSGYAAGTWSCTNGVAVNASSQITLANGQSTSCTINNDDQAATLTLAKTVTNDDGGTAAATAWTLTASGPTTISGATGAGAVTGAAVNAGTYTLCESGPSGYTAGTWGCTNGVTVNASSQITLANGQSTSCTINNNDQPATLTLVKTVTNDNGGTSAATAWTLTATGPTTISGATGSAAVTAAPVSSGTYTLSESGPGGYTASTWSCSNGVTVNGSSQITLTTAQATTCTINNNDQAATLTLVKTITNDNGGTAAATAWTLTATGPTTISGATGAAAITGATVSPGTYTLSESGGPAGYTASAWTCTNGITVNGSSQITLAQGQSTPCTINNHDQAATLTLAKTVTNDNGGTAAATAWTLTATGPTTISGATGAGAITGAAVSAGTYTLSETGPAGYTASAWTCTNGVTVNGSSQITLANGQSTSCTIDNNDQAATLTLVKTVTNDNGGTALAGAWTLAATGPTPISGATGTGAVTGAAVNAGTYTLSESGGPSGYTASAWTCSNGVTVNGSGQITLANGQSTSCTINNDDQAATLTLVKTVTNDNGGTAPASAWTLTATGPTTISGATGTGAVTGAAVSAGTYALGESGPAGYNATAWSCTNGITVNGSGQITLANGASTTCTINNDDQAATLTLAKTVTNDNGGTAAATAWTLTATGPTTISGTSGAGAVTGASVSAGDYTLSESIGPNGYAASAWSCTNGVVVSGGNQITLANGQSTLCTINNDDQAATLTLVKTVTNNDGGSALATAWTLAATGPTPISGASGTGAVTGAPVSAGTYTLSESGGPSGYTAGTWGCTNGVTVTGGQSTLANGQSTTCTIDNDDDKVSDLSISKTDSPDPVRAGETLTYTLTITNGGPTTIAAGDTFTVADTLPSGLTGCSYLASAGTYTPGTGAWTGATLAPLGTVTLTIACTVDAAFTGASLANTATVAPPTNFADPVPGNNTAGPVSTAVAHEADLAITKSNLASTLVAGSSTTYTIVVTNGGPANADNAVLTDPAVAGLSVTAVNCTSATGGGSCPASVTVALLQGSGLVIPSLPVGATVTFTVTATVTASGQ
jgi:uncharacterized repeat protein (TIGR01451 family)